MDIAKLTELEGGIGPNAMLIRKHAMRIIRCKVPAAVRKELMAAVKMGALGRLPKKGLLPEVFYHPDHLHSAKRRQREEAEFEAKSIAQALSGVMAPPHLTAPHQ